MKATVFETSSKTGENISDLFTQIARQRYRHGPSKMNVSGVLTAKNMVQKGGGERRGSAHILRVKVFSISSALKCLDTH